MDIPINADVICLDGSFGRSTHVIIMPSTEKITHMVINNGTFPGTEYLLPIDMIVASTPESIRVKCTRAELSKYPIFDQVDFIPFDVSGIAGGAYMAWPYYIPESAYGRKEKDHLPANELAIRRGAGVDARDGHIGRVDEFLVDPESDKITHLVLREGHLWGRKDVSIPVGEIDHYRANVVYLKLDKQAIEELPTIPIHRGFIKR